MSNKLTTTHHDGTAVNCINHLAVVAIGKRPNASRICMMPECAPSKVVQSMLKSKRDRRRKVANS